MAGPGRTGSCFTGSPDSGWTRCNTNLHPELSLTDSQDTEGSLDNYKRGRFLFSLIWENWTDVKGFAPAVFLCKWRQRSAQSSGQTDPKSNWETFLMKPCPHSVDSVKTRLNKSLIIIIIIIRATQAVKSFQCKAKAPEQSGVATILQIWGFLQLSSTSVKWAEKHSLEEQQQKRQNIHIFILHGQGQQFKHCMLKIVENNQN